VFDRLGRPSFFDEAVNQILGRIAVRIERQGIANRKSTSCAFAPQERGIRELAQAESLRLRREIERRFVRSGRLELPSE
jgi:hypothetical protein